MDKILDKLGLKYDDLNVAERETLNQWLETISKTQLTLEKVKAYVAAMRSSVAQEISKEPTFIRIFIFKVENPQLIRLQARLRNYIMLEDFLTAPDRARAAIDELANRVKGENAV